MINRIETPCQIMENVNKVEKDGGQKKLVDLIEEGKQ